MIKPLNQGLMNKFGSTKSFEPLTHIDGQSVAGLLKEYGSPLFVFSEQQIRQTYREAYRAFSTRYPKVQFAWSYKTNYLNAICRVFHQEGAWAEVVSGMEYEKAVLNGVAADKVIFNGPDKTNEELREAVAQNSPIHIDHLDELYRLIEIARDSGKRPQVAIRVNMDTGVYPMWDRFGFNYENGSAWDAINKIVLTDTLDLIGLHCHIGTFMLSTRAYAIAAGKLSELALRLKQKHGKQIKYLDLGGGFASKNTLKGSYMPGVDTSPGFDEYAEAICTALLNAGFEADELPLLVLETGRALIDEAGYLLGTVLANKRLADGRRATILDFGVNILFTAFWYDHEMQPAQEFGTHMEESVVYGPLCMNIDVVRDNVSLPPLQAGEQVVVRRVGAYNITQSMQFISLRPASILIDEQGQTHLIRKREKLASVQTDELLPDYLSKPLNL